MLETAAAKSPLRRAYGRGYYDALRAAGVSDPGAFVNAQKLEKIERALPTMSKLVLHAVPDHCEWDVAQIVSDIIRTTGSRIEPKTVRGILNALVGEGVVREPRDGFFVRVKVRPALSVAAAPAMPAPGSLESASVATQERKPEPSQEVSSSLDRLAVVAGALRLKAAELSDLAREVEEAALSAQERIDKCEAAASEGRQLAVLIGRLTSGAR